MMPLISLPNGRQLPLINAETISQFDPLAKKWTVHKSFSFLESHLKQVIEMGDDDVTAFYADRSFERVEDQIRPCMERFVGSGRSRTLEYVDLLTNTVKLSLPMIKDAEYESSDAFVYSEGFKRNSDPSLVTLNNINSNRNLTGVWGRVHRTTNTCYRYFCNPSGNSTLSSSICEPEDVVCVNETTATAEQISESFPGVNITLSLPGELLDHQRNWTASGYVNGNVWIKYFNHPVLGSTLRRDPDGSFKSSWNTESLERDQMRKVSTEPSAYYYTQIWDSFMRPKFSKQFCVRAELSDFKCNYLSQTLYDLTRNLTRNNATDIKEKPMMSAVNVNSFAPNQQHILLQLKTGLGKSPNEPIRIGRESEYGYTNAFFNPALGPSSNCSEGQCLAAFWYDKSPYFAYGQAQDWSRDWALNWCIAFHELQHGLTYELLPHLKTYTFGPQGSMADPGALNEGWSDYWAAILCKTDDFRKTASGSPNRWLNNTRRSCYSDLSRPSDIVGAVHADSMVFTGGLWEIREYLGQQNASNGSAAGLLQSEFDQIVLTSAAMSSVGETIANQFTNILGTIQSNSLLSAHLQKAKDIFQSRELGCPYRILPLTAANRIFTLPSKQMVGLSNYAAGTVQMMLIYQKSFASYLSRKIYIRWSQFSTADDFFQNYDKGINTRNLSFVVSVGCPVAFRFANGSQTAISSCTNDTLPIRQANVSVSTFLGYSSNTFGLIELYIDETMQDQLVYIHLINYFDVPFYITDPVILYDYGFWISFSYIVMISLVSFALFHLVK